MTTPFAIATLFDPLHSADLLLLGTRFLSMLACRECTDTTGLEQVLTSPMRVAGKALFYKIMGVKFYELEDVRTSRLAIFDRIASLLAAKREDTDSVSCPTSPACLRPSLPLPADSYPLTSAQAYNLDLALLALSNLLVMARDDAVLLVAGSDTFVSELLGKIWQDIRVLWEWDGRSVLAGSRERLRLNRCVARVCERATFRRSSSSLIWLQNVQSCPPTVAIHQAVLLPVARSACARQTQYPGPPRRVGVAGAATSDEWCRRRGRSCERSRGGDVEPAASQRVPAAGCS